MAIRYTNYKGEVETTFKGAVVSTHIQYGVRIMSDVWTDLQVLVCYDAKEDKIVRRSFDLYGLSGQYEFEIDATPKVAKRVAKLLAKEEAEKAAYKAKVEAERKAREAEEAKARAELDAKTSRGAKVVTLRKIKTFPKGTVGEVFWRGTCNFSGKPRVGIVTEDGDKVFVNAVSVKLTSAA